MYNRNLYRQILAGVSGIVALSLAGSWLLLTEVSYFLATLALAGIILLASRLVQQLNATNRKIACFFDSAAHSDSALRYPHASADPNLQKLHAAMNRLLLQIEENRNNLEERTQYYESLLHRLPIGVISATSGGKILSVNPAAHSLLQCSPLVRLQQLDNVEEGLYSTFATLLPGQRKLIRITNEREVKDLSLTASQIQMKASSVRLYSIQDIRQELDDKEADSWIRLIRVLTHEIMNSLTPITSLSEDLLLHQEESSPQQIKEGLEVIREQGANLIHFIHSYHRLTHLPSPQKTLIPLQELFGKVALLLTAEKGAGRISFLPPHPDTLSVYADKNLLTLVLINLIKNAIRATDSVPCGSIRVEARLHAASPQIVVTDNGCGIPPDLLTEIFVPFFTTHPDGNGIGLSISREIMRMHGGSLKVISREEQGSTFIIDFGK